MTIQELITALSQYDPNTLVVTSGYKGDYNNVSQIQEKTMQLNVNNKDYYGAHDCVKGLIVPDKPMVKVICLGGFNPNADDRALSYH